MYKKTYILGPMRGIDQYNFPEFDRASAHLKAHAYIPVNPAQMDREAGLNMQDLVMEGQDWTQYPACLDGKDIIKRDVAEVMTCDSFFCLEGWEKSTGARAEKALLEWQGATRLRVTEADFYGRPLAGHSPQVTPQVTPQLAMENSTGQVTGQVAGQVAGQVDSTNPKDLIGLKKPPLRLVPPALMIYTSRAMALGASRYGPYNWRAKKVRHSVYLEAALRHLAQALDGEKIDPESGVPHEAHVAACMAIILDAKSCGCMIDDLPAPGPSAAIIKELTLKS